MINIIRRRCAVPAILMTTKCSGLIFLITVNSGVASYGALGHVPLRDFQQFQFLFTMEYLNLTANYPNIV